MQAACMLCVMAAMDAFPEDEGVANNGCAALAYATQGDFPAAEACRQVMLDAGGVECVVAAMQAFPEDDGVQDNGHLVLDTTFSETGDVLGVARMVTSMDTHSENEILQLTGCRHEAGTQTDPLPDGPFTQAVMRCLKA